MRANLSLLLLGGAGRSSKGPPSPKLVMPKIRLYKCSNYMGNVTEVLTSGIRCQTPRNGHDRGHMNMCDKLFLCSQAPFPGMPNYQLCPRPVLLYSYCGIHPIFDVCIDTRTRAGVGHPVFRPKYPGDLLTAISIQRTARTI
jgi:hypothetical protein